MSLFRRRSKLTAFRLCQCSLSLSVFLFSAGAAAMELAFIDLTVFDRNIEKNVSNIESSDFVPRATLFYSNTFGSTKFLSEFAANSNHSHFGRFKLGWDLDSTNTIWVGRTHNPSNYWRDQYHHGGWLQPSINRPAIAEFEVPGGIIPAHSTGLLFEGGATVGNQRGWAYIASYGYTATLDSNGLELPNIIDTERSRHNVSLAFKLSYRFEALAGGNEIGILGSNNHITDRDNAIIENEQSLFGAFFNWHFSDLHIISELYFIENNLVNFSSVTNGTDEFVNGYIMADYGLNDDWSVYSRLENTKNEEGSLYLGRFPNFVTKRNLLGIRYSINRSQMLKLEIEDSEIFAGDQYQQLSLQWSYVYP